MWFVRAGDYVLYDLKVMRTLLLFGRSIGKSGTGVHGVIVLKLKISPS